MELEIRSPIGNTRGPLAMESLLRAIHRAEIRGSELKLRLRSAKGTVGLSADLPDDLRALFLQELQDAYPGTLVNVLKPSSAEFAVETSATLQLMPDVLSIRNFESFLDVTDGRQFSDPVAGLLSAIRTGNSGRLECEIELMLRVPTDSRLRRARRISHRLQAGFRSPQLRRWYVPAAANHHWLQRLWATVLGRIAYPDVITAIQVVYCLSRGTHFEPAFDNEPPLPPADAFSRQDLVSEIQARVGEMDRRGVQYRLIWNLAGDPKVCVNSRDMDGNDEIGCLLAEEVQELCEHC
ncbi:MAG: hypothetical protein WBH28_03755 [Fuerstiella sp.]